MALSLFPECKATVNESEWERKHISKYQKKRGCKKYRISQISISLTSLNLFE